MVRIEENHIYIERNDGNLSAWENILSKDRLAGYIGEPIDFELTRKEYSKFKENLKTYRTKIRFCPTCGSTSLRVDSRGMHCNNCDEEFLVE